MTHGHPARRPRRRAGRPGYRGPVPPEDPGTAALPADSHVHTEFSWDTAVGDMEATCARAEALGLPAVAFTEHVDLTAWTVHPHEVGYVPETVRHLVPEGGVYRAPAFDAAGYLAAVERCRSRYPGLRILTGLEVGEPHWHDGPTRALLASGTFDRVLGSLHSLMARGGAADVCALLAEQGPAEALRAYLAEALALVESPAPFEVLAHVDYPVRAWRFVAGDFDPLPFEDEYRAVLTALARSGRALELNTRLPMPERLLVWWRECGGRGLTFGSDAHRADDLARGFAEAARTAVACGFRAGRAPHDPWRPA